MDPRDHILAYLGPPDSQGASAVTLLISPRAFSRETLGRIERAAERLRFEPVLTPEAAADDASWRSPRPSSIPARSRA